MADARLLKIKADIEALPTEQKFRLVADLIDNGQLQIALPIAEEATRELRAKKASKR